MRGRAPHYPGLTDPRADLERLRETYDYVLGLMRRFHPTSPAYPVLHAILTALHAAALELTRDPYFFGLAQGGQSLHRPPPAPPIPGLR
jgi:hypothetical protein